MEKLLRDLKAAGVKQCEGVTSIQTQGVLGVKFSDHLGLNASEVCANLILLIEPLVKTGSSSTVVESVRCPVKRGILSEWLSGDYQKGDELISNFLSWMPEGTPGTPEENFIRSLDPIGQRAAFLLRPDVAAPVLKSMLVDQQNLIQHAFGHQICGDTVLATAPVYNGLAKLKTPGATLKKLVTLDDLKELEDNQDTIRLAQEISNRRHVKKTWLLGKISKILDQNPDILTSDDSSNLVSFLVDALNTRVALDDTNPGLVDDVLSTIQTMLQKASDDATLSESASELIKILEKSV